MPTYSLINNGESGLSVRTTLNDLLTDINNGVYIGPTGATGFSGTSGTSGSSGTSAVDGTSGTSGAQGTSGAAGTSGSSGTSGAQGTSGASGTSGSSGTSGTAGGIGATGPSPFPADFIEVYIDPTGTTASILSTTSSWSNNILGPTGISGTLAGQRHYDTTVGYVYEAVEDNTWLRYNIGAGATGATGSGATGATGAAGATGSVGVTQSAFGITIDGGGATVSTGVKGYISIPYAGTITEWTLLGDQTGDIVIDVWKDTYANFPPTSGDSIAGTEKPTLSSQSKNQDTDLTSWTTSVNADDIIAFNVDSASNITWCNLTIKINRS